MKRNLSSSKTFGWMYTKHMIDNGEKRHSFNKLRFYWKLQRDFTINDVYNEYTRTRLSFLFPLEKQTSKLSSYIHVLNKKHITKQLSFYIFWNEKQREENNI